MFFGDCVQKNIRPVVCIIGFTDCYMGFRFVALKILLVNAIRNQDRNKNLNIDQKIIFTDNVQSVYRRTNENK